MTVAGDLADWTSSPNTCELVRRAARRRPDRPALLDGGTVVTYGELDRRAESLSRRLVDQGAGPGSFIAVALPRSADHVIATLAVWKAGGVCVPVAADLPAAHVAEMLLTAAVSLSVGPGLVLSEIAPPAEGRRSVELPTASDGEDGSVAYVYFTSGSTGRPKAVALTHAGIANEAQWSQKAFSLSEHDRSTWLASPGFAISRWELWTPLTVGASVVISEENVVRDAAELRDWLVSVGATWSIIVTGLAERLFGVDWPASCPLRLLVAGGDQLRLWPEALPFDVVNSYGVTEASSVRLAARLDPAERSGRLPSVGQPISNTYAYLLNDELTPVPDGEVGELFIGGYGLARGYLGDPEQTRERFLPDPFRGGGRRMYRTGDLVRRGESGDIEFTGRRNNDPKVGGVRVDPAAVESALLTCPGVTDAAAVVRAQGPDRARLVGYLVSEDRAQLEPDSIIDGLARLLPRQMVPTELVWLPSMPLLPSGKVARGQLPPPSAQNVLRGRRASAGNEAEAHVIAVFQEVLGRADVSANDDFFGLGGDSLGVARVRQALLDRHGIDVAFTDIFRRRTPHRISVAVQSAGKETT
ncbi:non-ribosomal peptide synthetase [Streptomyces sp. NPDC048430]|uniref:non-ribosomal peptide synthetase n=1 Tax=Streptomyces sp. NPDC048430 TaxID=3155388 RepID=UPI0034419729